MSSRRDSDNIQPFPDREHLPEEFAAMGLPTGDDTRIIINLKEGHTAARAAFRLLFRPHILIPALLGAAVERVARSIRKHTGAAAVAGTAVAGVLVVGGAAFALASNDRPLAMPPAVVERVTLPPSPAVTVTATHMVTETARMERTIPPSVVELQSPPRAQAPASGPRPGRPTARPSARSSQQPPRATSRPEPRAPATSSAAPRPTAIPRPQPTTRPSLSRPMSTQEADPPRTPEETRAPDAPQASEPTQKPETPQTSEPAQPPESSPPPQPKPSADPPTSKPCTIQIGIGGIRLCVSL